MSLTRQQKLFYKTFSQHGSGNALVSVMPKDIALLAHIAHHDLNDSAEWYIPEFAELANVDFYSITPAMIDSLPELREEDAFRLLELIGATDINDIMYLYMKNLSELYRRRFKFYNILKTQPFPSPEQIGLRCLLEYGNCSDELLFSWMTWRKLIYDIDNRSAQETGYLFEPILASCLGGESVSHKNSPVKRIDDNGNATNEGRQVDCYIEEAKEVYELKLRVTIAASGQGRFGEEMSFPYEARRAGLTPVLVVFDSTPSALLDKLKEKYEQEGGHAVIGEAAWAELSQKAGNEMGRYILKYIKPPIAKMEQICSTIPADIKLSATDTSLSIKSIDGNVYCIPRTQLSE